MHVLSTRPAAAEDNIYQRGGENWLNMSKEQITSDFKGK